MIIYPKLLKYSEKKSFSLLYNELLSHFKLTQLGSIQTLEKVFEQLQVEILESRNDISLVNLCFQEKLEQSEAYMVVSHYFQETPEDQKVVFYLHALSIVLMHFYPLALAPRRVSKGISLDQNFVRNFLRQPYPKNDAEKMTLYVLEQEKIEASPNLVPSRQNNSFFNTDK